MANNSNLQNQRNNNLQVGDILIPQSIFTYINADKSTYTDNRNHPCMYVGDFEVVSNFIDSSGNDVLVYNNTGVVDELETHRGKTYHIDVNGNYDYNPTEDETIIDNSNTIGLQNRSVAQGKSYSLLDNNSRYVIIGNTTDSNLVTELISKLRNYGNVILENIKTNTQKHINENIQFDIENVKFNVSGYFMNHNDIELRGNLVYKGWGLSFIYNYRNSYLVLMDGFNDTITCNNFGTNDLEVFGKELYDEENQSISDEDLSYILSQIESLILQYDRYISENNKV